MHLHKNGRVRQSTAGVESSSPAYKKKAQQNRSTCVPCTGLIAEKIRIPKTATRNRGDSNMTRCVRHFTSGIMIQRLWRYSRKENSKKSTMSITESINHLVAPISSAEPELSEKTVTLEAAIASLRKSSALEEEILIKYR